MAHPSTYDHYYIYSHQPPPQSMPQELNDRNGINTLFVSGLPDDVKAREIHNLFRRRSGFDYCQLKYTGRGNQVVAFATFLNHQSAVSALHALNGVKFDPQTGSTLHIELARSNSRRKRRPGSGPYVVIDERTKAKDNTQEASSDDESEPDQPSETNNLDSDDNGDLATAKRLNTLHEHGETAVDPSNARASEKTEKTGDVGPCSTLFIANLGPNCTEDELKQVFSLYPGFNILKLRARGGMPVAFADFEEVEQATNAMEGLRESTLPSSDRGGMHIEYARSKMRKKP